MQSGKAHVYYKVNKKKPANASKMQEAVKEYVKLLSRFAKAGPTKWIVNAVSAARTRMLKYKVNLPVVEKTAGFDVAALKKPIKIKKVHKVHKEGVTTEKKILPKKSAKKSPVKKMATIKKPKVEKKTTVVKKKVVAKKPVAKGGRKAPVKKGSTKK